MRTNSDWVKSVMIPAVALAGLVGAVMGGWLRYDFHPAPPTTLPAVAALALDGAASGAAVCAAPAWVVMWTVWFVRRLRA